MLSRNNNKYHVLTLRTPILGGQLQKRLMCHSGSESNSINTLSVPYNSFKEVIIIGARNPSMLVYHNVDFFTVYNSNREYENNYANFDEHVVY